MGERTVQSILAFSRNQDGGLEGSWISFFGATRLKDVTFEDNQLGFTYVRRGRNGEVSSVFKGTIENRKITGSLNSDRGESKVTGERATRIPRGTGNWTMTIKAGEREYTGTLSVKADASGELAGEWSSPRGVSPVSDLVVSRNELSFVRTIKTQDIEWKASFSGSIQGNVLEGVVKSERGEAQVNGKRHGGLAIGTWNLNMESNQRTRKQRLRIHSDLSGFFGSMAIEKVHLDGNKISFKTP
ncbi:MAG: hypothetical protein P8L18_12070 [Verrucomicrobiota bacterium]|nr:hypothetical protein [Verrucomicrobiota bacterium]